MAKSSCFLSLHVKCRTVGGESAVQRRFGQVYLSFLSLQVKYIAYGSLKRLRLGRVFVSFLGLKVHLGLSVLPTD